MKRHLIVGGSGTVASGVVKALVQRGETVHALTSQAQRAGTRDGVTWIHADVASGAGVREAFAGVDRAFLFAPPGYVPQDRILVPLIEEAQRRKLEKVVLMSAMGANADDSTPLRQAELRLERSGLPWNIVRPNWFMQNFNHSFVSTILEQGKILLPAGTAKASFIDARDISAVIARLLVTDDVDNRAFDLTGGEALDHHEVAAALSRVTGRKIRYEEITPEAMRAGLLAAGLPKDYADFLVLILGFLSAGYNERLTGEVEALLGRKPTTFQRYALDYKQAWTAVRAA